MQRTAPGKNQQEINHSIEVLKKIGDRTNKSSEVKNIIEEYTKYSNLPLLIALIKQFKLENRSSFLDVSISRYLVLNENVDVALNRETSALTLLLSSEETLQIDDIPKALELLKKQEELRSQLADFKLADLTEQDIVAIKKWCEDTTTSKKWHLPDYLKKQLKWDIAEKYGAEIEEYIQRQAKEKQRQKLAVDNHNLERLLPILKKDPTKLTPREVRFFSYILEKMPEDPEKEYPLLEGLYNEALQIVQQKPELLEIKPPKQVIKTITGSSDIYTLQSQGKRQHQEDRFCAGTIPELDELDEKEIQQVLQNTLSTLHQKLFENPKITNKDSGSTLSGIVICRGNLYNVNVGDSMAFLATKDKGNRIRVMPITKMLHTANESSELDYLIKKNVFVDWQRRVGKNGLAISRSFGDKICFNSNTNWARGDFCRPDIRVLECPKDIDAIVINASDGLSLPHLVDLIHRHASIKSDVLLNSTCEYLTRILTASWSKKSTLSDLILAIKDKVAYDMAYSFHYRGIASADNLTIMATRINQESKPTPTYMVVADGHGEMGKLVSEFLTRHFDEILKNTLQVAKKRKENPQEKTSTASMLSVIGDPAVSVALEIDSPVTDQTQAASSVAATTVTVVKPSDEPVLSVTENVGILGSSINLGFV